MVTELTAAAHAAELAADLTALAREPDAAPEAEPG